MAKLLLVLISWQYYLVCVCLALCLGLATVLCPIYLQKVGHLNRDHQHSLRHTTSSEQDVPVSADTVCIYVDGLLFRTPYASIVFGVMGVLVPACFMTFFYINIFKNVRRARIDRWFNQAAARCSRLTATVTQAHRRRTNVFQIGPGIQHTDLNSVYSNTAREKSVLVKGIRSVSIILICWTPFAAHWVYLSLNGLSKEDTIRLKYLIILAKCSSLLNIAHYICFNIKFKKMYANTLRWPLSVCFGWSESHIYPEENTSQIDSNVLTPCNISAVYTLAAVGRPNLATIFERPVGVEPTDCKTLKTESSTMPRRASLCSLATKFK